MVNSIKAKPARRLYKKDFKSKSDRFASKSRKVQLRTHRMLNHLSSKTISRTALLNNKVKQLIEKEKYLRLNPPKSIIQFAEERMKLVKKVDSLIDSLNEEKLKIAECEKLGNTIFTSFKPTRSAVFKNIQLERDLHASWNNLNQNLTLLEILNRQLSGKAPSLKSIQRNREIGRDKI